MFPLSLFQSLQGVFDSMCMHMHTCVYPYGRVSTIKSRKERRAMDFSPRFVMREFHQVFLQGQKGQNLHGKLTILRCLVVQSR